MSTVPVYRVSLRERIDEIGREFAIVDRARLSATIGVAMTTLAEARVKDLPENDDREGDTLDKLETARGTVIALVEDRRNGNRLTDWVRRRASGALMPCVPDLLLYLHSYQSGAAEMHRTRVPPRGPLACRDVRAAAKILIDYWGSLGKTYTHQPWAQGQDSLEPITEGDRFVHKVLRIFEPAAADEFRTLAREFTGNRRSHGKTP